jgi:hypothetical protein
LDGLNQDPNHATERRSDSHGRHKDTCRYFASVGDYDEESAKDGSDEQRENRRPAILTTITCQQVSDCVARPSNLLAQAVIIMTALALKKQDLHTFRHINTQKFVRVANNSRRCGEYGGFKDRILTKIALSESLHSEVPFDDKRAIQTAEYSEDDVEEDFEEVPLAIVAYGEHDELSCTEGIHGLGCVSLSCWNG